MPESTAVCPHCNTGFAAASEVQVGLQLSRHVVLNHEEQADVREA